MEIEKLRPVHKKIIEETVITLHPLPPLSHDTILRGSSTLIAPEEAEFTNQIKEIYKEFGKKGKIMPVREVVLRNPDKETRHPREIFVGTTAVERGAGIRHVYGAIHDETTGTTHPAVKVEVPLSPKHWELLTKEAEQRLGKKGEFTLDTAARVIENVLGSLGHKDVEVTASVETRDHLGEAVPVLSILVKTLDGRMAPAIAMTLEEYLKKADKS